MVTVNVVVLAGTVAADPVERRMPSGDEVGERRTAPLAQPEDGMMRDELKVSFWRSS
jgi:single-stranded DNA-binding protein